MARRRISPIGLSFLDAITCGFGATILFYMIINASSGLRAGQVTADLRGETAIAVASAKVLAARTALDVTTRVFDALGARATHNRLGLDRFWRDVRTHSLHDPLAYKVLEVGRYAVNGQYPDIRAYT